MGKRVADIIMDILVEKNIKDCFMVVGGGAMHLNNAFALRDDIQKTFCHHEQACAMAAEAYARACGKLAVVCVTSGPGALNTLNGVEGAWVDNIPMLILSGQSRYATSVEASGLPLRYRGVQEFEIVNSVKNMTKYAKKIKEPCEIRRELEYAIELAMAGRRGPVWIDLPLDVQSTLIEEEDLLPADKEIPHIPSASDEDVLKLLSLLGQANRPVLLTGSGIRSSNTTDLFRKAARFLSIPVIGGSLQADILYNGFPRYYGMAGNTGPRAGNIILQNADLIVVLGNSLGYKQTGFAQEQFAPSAKIVMVDIDENEAKKPGLHIDWLLQSDLSVFFQKMLQLGNCLQISEKWIAYCEKVYRDFPACEYDMRENEESYRVSLYEFWNAFSELESEDSIVALGNSNCIVGRLQMGVKCPQQRVLVNYNCGSMGDDLPEAVGVCIALKKPITCVTGDGSIMMNLQELQTIVHNQLPIKTVVFSNDGYGAIRQTNKNFFAGLYIGCDAKSGVSFPNFEKVASAFGIPYRKCSQSEELNDSIIWLNSQKLYALLEIEQKIDDPIIPKVMSRMRKDKTFESPALHDMFPFIDKTILNKYMMVEEET